MKLRKVRGLVRIIILALIVYGCFMLASVFRRLDEAEARLTELQAASAELQTENEELQYDIDHADDPETIEEIAREKLGFVMPGEKIYYDAGN